jgi:hypothetical protein
MLDLSNFILKRNNQAIEMILWWPDSAVSISAFGTEKRGFESPLVGIKTL